MKWIQLTDILDGRFSINENGEVLNTITNHIISPYINNKGYPIVDLNANGKREKWLVHRLMAIAFLPNPENLPVVMHLDDNRLNFSINNLKWGTYLENNKQAIDEGHIIVPKPDNRKHYIIYNENNLWEDPIYCYGIQEIINNLGFGNDSQIRNYIYIVNLKYLTVNILDIKSN